MQDSRKLNWNTKRFTFIIVFIFLILWMPFGQTDFLLYNWMKIGTYSIPFLLLIGFIFRKEQIKNIFDDTKFTSILLLIIYLIHQFEEHWIDIFGNEYAFYKSVNKLVSDILSPSLPISPLTPEAIFVINTSLVWLVGLIAIRFSDVRKFPVFAMAAITLVNAITHVMAGVIKWIYNPGLLTSILLFIPFTISFYFHILTQNPKYKLQVIASIVWAVFAHILMVTGMLASNYFHFFPESIYFLLLVVWSLLPIFVFV